MKLKELLINKTKREIDFIQSRWNREIYNFSIMYVRSLQEIILKISNAKSCNHKHLQDFIFVYDFTVSELVALYSAYETHAKNITPTCFDDAVIGDLMDIGYFIGKLIKGE
ncbi:hypothetical protein [Serratia sp. D1N4]